MLSLGIRNSRVFPSPQWQQSWGKQLVLVCFLVCLNGLPGPPVVAQPPKNRAEARVELELFFPAGANPAFSHAWLNRLKRYEPDGLRIRAAQAEDKVQVIDEGTPRSPAYRVLGMITPSEELVLPGLVVPPDRPGLVAEFIKALKERGPEAVEKPRTAFGLTVPEFARVHDDLALTWDESTLGRDALELVDSIAKKLQIPLKYDAEAKAALSDPSAAARDELQGLSAGTCLAAIVRPAGLVLEVESQRGKLGYAIRPAQPGREFWPIGWEPERKKLELIPQLIKTFEVELKGIPLTRAAEAIQSRLEVPFVYDYNSMLENGIFLDEKKVTIKKKRLPYESALDQVLGQGGLKLEVRVDEANHPFLWITTIRPVNPERQRD